MNDSHKDLIVTQIITPTVVAKECRFAVYVSPPEQGMSDLHVIKERVTYSDGTSKSELKLVKDFQRPFWVTKKGMQNHKDKKEWELVDNLIEGKSTQSKLVENCARALGNPGFSQHLRKLSTSPYLYGSDILSTAIIKKTYQNKYPDLQTKYSVAVFDVETDVINGTGEVIIASITFKSVVYTTVVRSFIQGLSDVDNRVNKMMDKYLGEYVTSRGIVSELVIVDTPMEAIALCFKKAHELQPDLLAIWNITFDIEKTLAACEKERVDPADLFSDPSIPKEYRYFKFIKGPHQKVTASGLVTPIKPAAQWHTVVCPASFYIVDAMCVFKHNRTGQPELQSYSLDFVLNEMLGIRKLKFEEANHIKSGTLPWHRYMQLNHKLEYIIYNRFDCISIEVLDEKTNDMSMTFPSFAGFSDFANYKSQPRRAVDNLHYYCLGKNQVIGSTGGETSTEFDTMTLGLDGWIITLPAHLVADNGLKIIEENPEMVTNVRGHVGDLDVAGAYPTNECVFNVSKETTRKEIVSIQGVDLFTQKMQTINISAGHVNAAEFCQTMLGFPKLDVLLEHFNKRNTA